MSDRDKKLAEMMGMCWHEADYFSDGKWDKNCLHYYVPCRKCKLILYSPDKTVYNPDFSTPEWRAKLMDFCVEQELLPDLLAFAFNKSFDECEEGVESFFHSDSSRDTFYTYEVYAYLWHHLPALVDQYWREK